MADDWQPVGGDDWQPVGASAPEQKETPPPAFIDRLIRGDALHRALAPLTSAAKGAAEGFGSEPFGLSEEHVHQLRQLGIYSDPATGRGGALRFMNEAIGQPAFALGDLVLRSGGAAVGAMAGAFSQYIEDAEGALGNPEKAKNEATNFLNYTMLRGDHEFSRIDHSSVGPVDQPVGIIPTDRDFAAAAKALEAPEQSLRDLWQERGIHPAEAVHDAIRDALLKHDIEHPAAALGADVTSVPISTIEERPPTEPGRLMNAGRKAIEQTTGLMRNIQYILDPMATGSDRAMVIAKDAMNSVRRVRFEHLQFDGDIVSKFDREQQTRMWNALDEESVLRQESKTSEHMGLATLEPDERAAVERLMERSRAAWANAIDAGIVEGEGLPAYAPRIMLNVAAASKDLNPRALNELGRNVFTRTSQMLHRSYLTAEESESAAKSLVEQRMKEQGASPEEIQAAVDKVQIARNIRSLPLATARLEEATIWRQMINNIENVGKQTGQETVAVGFKPSNKWFTIAGNPAFTKWKAIATDANGNAIFKPVPLYMSDEFKGPMHAILDEGFEKNKVVPGAPSLYGFLMAIKAKSMTAILNSPLIHNEVVWSKAMEAAGGREWLGFGLYFRGNRIFHDPTRSAELIERGLNPMGKRGSYQDITGEMEQPNLETGHYVSWTGKLLAFIPGLFDVKAGAAVERAIAAAGNFTHNTLLWDRVRDLQFGLADHLSDRLVAKGADRLTADRIAAHFSNIIVGSIPKEAMSEAARATANMLLFSRSFTLGNLSTFKQAALGLPKPLLAQIERDHLGAGPEGFTPEAAAEIKGIASGIARRKAISTIVMSAGLYYIGNALLQNAFNIAARDSSIEEEMNAYARRYANFMADVKADPFELRHLVGRLSPVYDNEPGKQDRVMIGHDKDGTAIYARNPTGKFGEEMVGYPTMPLEMIRRKLSPMAGGILEVLENDKGFGRKIYDENDTTVQGDIKNAFAVAKHLVERHLPSGQIQAGMDLLRGDGSDTLNKLRVFAPMVGFTASQGAPGGEARGEQLHAKQAFEIRFSLAWPDIRKQVQRGDTVGARESLKAIGAPPGMINGLIRNAQNPSGALHGRTLLDFYHYATPEQVDRFERARERGGQP